jgi:general stress protein 26
VTESLGELQDRSFARANPATASSYPPENRLSAAQLAAYLDRRSFAVVGSARPDGRPHAAMTSYRRRDTEFWLPTVAGSARERNVRAHPWLTLVVTEGDHDEHIAVLLEGPAEMVELAHVPADVRDTNKSDWVSVWIRLRAERVLSYASKSAPGLR